MKGNLNIEFVKKINELAVSKTKFFVVIDFEKKNHLYFKKKIFFLIVKLSLRLAIILITKNKNLMIKLNHILKLYLLNLVFTKKYLIR